MQYLDLRFGRPTRIVASFAFTLQMVLYMGIVVYAPSLALSAVTGLNKVGAILAIGLVCTFYSTIGGMKAVLITDVFQVHLYMNSIEKCKAYLILYVCLCFTEYSYVCSSLLCCY